MSPPWCKALDQNTFYQQYIRFLLKKNHPELPEFTNKWAFDLNVEIGVEEWEKSFTLTNCLSLATKAQETSYKLVSCWYRCPTSLQRIFPDALYNCWRCHSAKGSLLHIWWECPQICKFWDSIMQLYTIVTGEVIPNTPQITLLSILPGSYKNIKKGLLRHLVIHF